MTNTTENTTTGILLALGIVVGVLCTIVVTHYGGVMASQESKIESLQLQIQTSSQRYIEDETERMDLQLQSNGCYR